jgi:S1-C subfamily serine protease
MEHGNASAMKKLSAIALAAGLAASALAGDEPPRMKTGTAEARFAISPPPAPPAIAPVPGSYAPLLASVTPAVVSVFPASLVHESQDGTDPLDRFFGKAKPEGGEKSPDDEERIQGVGSGVILTTDGWIVTNGHVVRLASGRLADAISVELHDGRRFAAKIAGVDAATDLALLKISATGLDPLPIADSDGVRLGDLVFAVGNPFKVGITATMGMVSAIRRTGLELNGPGGYENFIQTDAPINPGNSGGALVDATGRLIGINTAIFSTSGGNVGIGFAIPSNLMRRVLAGLAEEGKIVRGFFGISTEDLTVLPGDKNELLAGAKVEEVMTDGPSEKAGVKAGDVIVRAGGQPVENRGDLRLAMSFVKPGGTLEIEFVRAGKKQTATLAAIADPGANTKNAFTLAALPGVKFRQGAKFLVVDSITSEAGDRTQLEPDMEILEVNGEKTATASAVEAALRKGINKLKVRSEDIEETLAVRVQ